MFKFIKTRFIQHKISVNSFSKSQKVYPLDIKKVGFLCLLSKKPDANLITKLKATFGNQTQFLIFVISDNVQNDEAEYINYECFDLFGDFKNKVLKESLQNVDMLIDMTQQQNIVKDYVISIANQAYKISLGQYSNNIYNLSINLKIDDDNLFVEEIIKYHKILSHAK